MSVWNAVRRRSVLGVLAAPALVVACGGSSGSQGAPDTSGELHVQPVIPGTDLAVGPNRFALGVLTTPKGQTAPSPVPDAQLKLTFFNPITPQPAAKGEATPQFRFVDDKRKGLYVAQFAFDQPGDWGVQVEGTANGQPIAPARVKFTVKPKPGTPAIGSPAPRSRNLTRKDVSDIKKIDSGIQANDMHELSIADALDLNKPLVVLFASPGFCVTQTCAPELGEVQKLEAKYRQDVSFVHVEIYKDPATRTPYETVEEWGLESDPWVFMVDRGGLVAAKFEGPAPFSELEPSLQKLL